IAPSHRPTTTHATALPIMDVIEQQVRLPKDAVALNRYSRFYTATKSGDVIGTYVAGAHDDLAVGQRRWVKRLPLIDDGGCFIVNVYFDPKRKKVTQAFCNGIA
ncbi:MAG: hypothetical protein ACOYLK_17940, partial [Sphingomonas sp.]